MKFIPIWVRRGEGGGEAKFFLKDDPFETQQFSYSNLIRILADIFRGYQNIYKDFKAYVIRKKLEEYLFHGDFY